MTKMTERARKVVGSSGVAREKVTIDTSDPETKAIWETALRARAEVASWPKWKKGE